MKKKANKKRKKTPAQPKKKKLSSRAKTLIILASTAFGITAGCLFWYYVSRCTHTHCFYHNWPLKEVLVAGIFFALASFVFLNGDIGKPYRYNRKTK
ncbi:MAG: hypothetical protein BGP01_00620 [Paludibacter sp. 47-17]|nr:MAG: hypothetical protein BGP01_00620 [Paludibacter sp. 47-17]